MQILSEKNLLVSLLLSSYIFIRGVSLCLVKNNRMNQQKQGEKVTRCTIKSCFRGGLRSCWPQWGFISPQQFKLKSQNNVSYNQFRSEVASETSHQPAVRAGGRINPDATLLAQLHQTKQAHQQHHESSAAESSEIRRKSLLTRRTKLLKRVLVSGTGSPCSTSGSRPHCDRFRTTSGK